MIRVFRVHSLQISLICVDQRKSAAPEKFPLNKISPLLNFIRFFSALRFFVASTFAARV